MLGCLVAFISNLPLLNKTVFQKKSYENISLLTRLRHFMKAVKAHDTIWQE